jgi:peroxiredoxin
MLQAGQRAPNFGRDHADGQPYLLVFLETDCPTCRLTIPYLNKLANQSARVIGISQDSESLTRQFVEQTSILFPVELDRDLRLSRAYDPIAVPALFLVGGDGHIIRSQIGFDKGELNAVAEAMGRAPVADAYDGAPQQKPGCSSRHLEPSDSAAPAEPLNLHATVGARASRVEVSEDPYEYCMRVFGDALPVVPPTVERVERMMEGRRGPGDVIGRIPPCYGEATIEKIAANAVMAGCAPEMMRVLIPLVRAACDERFNAHGGRPDGIDMSALGNPGKFSYCIAENEEESPWEPLHVELGFQPAESTITLFAAEAPHGVSEHMSRTAKGVLKAITRALATVWSYRTCMSSEALVVLGPEHVKTIHRDGFSKQNVREFLFENTGIPVRAYDDEGEGAQQVRLYRQITIDGELCYQKFRAPEAIKIVVAGGTAGKFSAVIGSWAAGPRGSQMVTYPCP